MKRQFLFAIILLSVAISCFSQTRDEMTKAREAEQLAGKAYQAKEYPDYLANMLLANEARPNHPRLIYNLASAYAVNARPEEALVLLERLAKMGLFYAIGEDEDFRALFASDRFKAIQAMLAENRKPMKGSSQTLTLADKTLITEGVAYNPKTQTFYIGSVHQRKIVAVDKNGTATDLSVASDGLWSVLGMKVDIARGWLWVCSAAFPQIARVYGRGQRKLRHFQIRSADRKACKEIHPARRKSCPW